MDVLIGSSNTTRLVMKMLESRQATLWVSADVHFPFFPTKGLRDSTDESKRSLYYAVLQAMDQQLGLLLDYVRNDAALRSNTQIVVVSDNGHEDGAGCLSLFEAGSPGFMRVICVCH